MTVIGGMEVEGRVGGSEKATTRFRAPTDCDHKLGTEG